MSLEHTPLEKLWNTAYDLRFQGHFELAKELYLEILDSAQAKLRVDTLNELSICQRALNEFKDAIKSSFDALSIATIENYLPGKADAFHHLGVLSQITGAFEDALIYLRKSIKTNEDTGARKIAIALSLLHIGIVSRQKGQLDKAEGDFYSAYRLFQIETGPEANIGTLRVIIQLANSKLLKGNPIDALETYKRALEIANNLKNSFRYSLIQRMSALCYWWIESNSKANFAFTMSLTEAERSSRIDDLAICKFWKGLFHWSQSQTDEAFSLLSQSLGHFRLIKNLKLQQLNLFYLVIFSAKYKNDYLEHFLSGLEKLWKDIKKNENQKSLILLQIQFSRILRDQINKPNRKYSLSMIRKYEKVLRLTRGHNYQDNLALIIYTYLFEALIQGSNLSNDKNDNYNENKKQVYNLLNQANLDIKGHVTLHNYFKIIKALIEVYFDLNFSPAIETIKKSKLFFQERGMKEHSIHLDTLIIELVQKLELLLEYSELEQKPPENQKIKNLVQEFQLDLQDKIKYFLDYFRFKIMLVKDILDPIMI